MYKNQKITIYIPCRNESQSLTKLIGSIPLYVDEIIVVSNNSTDDTYKKALSLGVKAVREKREINGIGYGFAHMRGIAESTGDIIIAVDGDGEHPVNGLNELIEHMIDKQIDFLSCSRIPPREKSIKNIARWVGVSVLNLEVKLLYGVEIKDILSGMWLIKKDIKNDLSLTCGDWNLSPEIKIKALINPEIKFEEIHVEQTNREFGRSKQVYLKTGLSHMIWILKNRLGFKNTHYLKVKSHSNATQ